LDNTFLFWYELGAAFFLDKHNNLNNRKGKRTPENGARIAKSTTWMEKYNYVVANGPYLRMVADTG
jgi:hypothetical protein